MTQTEHILAHLDARGSITPLDALDLFGCFRLAARIAELRADGHDIRTERTERGGKAFATYRLHRAPAQAELAL